VKTVEEKVLNRIYGFGRGRSFTPKNFLDLGSRGAIDMALANLSQKGTIRRVARGIYDYPRKDKDFGISPPDPDAIALALVTSAGARIQPTGAYAANILGLSEQVPAKFEYYTDADDRTVVVDTRTIRLKRTTPRNMKMAGRASGLITQAFRYLGKENITPEIIATLRDKLSEKEKQQLVKDISFPPAWIADHFRQIIKSTEAP